MAGHSHWAGIKHQKEIVDKKKARVFAKLLSLISAAAKSEPNPDFNPRLRTAIEKARAEKVPADTIERAVKRASEAGAAMDEITLEAYGPGGAAILIEAIADNQNRAVQEVKKVLSGHEGKWAEQGSVAWAFEQDATTRGWRAKFPLSLAPENAKKLEALVAALEELDDLRAVWTNAS